MPYYIEFDPYEFMIKATAQGNINLSELTKFITGILLCAKEDHCFYIRASLEQAELSVSLAEFSNLPATVRTIIHTHGLNDQKFSIAMVAREDQELLHHYETVSRNSGLEIKLFYEMEAARNWLRKVQSNYFLEKRW